MAAEGVLHRDGSIGTDNELFTREETAPECKRESGKKSHTDLLSEWRVIREWGVNSHANVLRLFRSQRRANPVL